jgi:F0F1-type ATP synthase membrane subunit c/vacuolar-type H+-ATPase subunit K
MSQLLPIAVALSIGLGTIGAGLAIGLSAAQAFAAIGRNPDNADINGAGNIIRKAAPDAFGQRVGKGRLHL